MRHPQFLLNPAPLTLAIAMALCASGIAHAQATRTDKTVAISIAAQPLGAALNELAAATGVPVAFSPASVAGRTAPAVTGNLTVQQVLDRLLAGTGLIATAEGPAMVVRMAPAASETKLPAVVVTANADRETATGPVNGFVAERSATGTKTDTLIIETPQSISVITSDFLQATGATRIRDALAYTPGVTVPYGADSRYDWVHLRGFDAFSPGYFLDGLQMRNNGQTAWQNESYGAERIEVLRGPSSVLYGQSVAGGMINIVSKRPTVERRAEMQVQLGSGSRRQVAGDFSGPLNADGEVLYRINGLIRDAELAVNGQLPDDRFFVAPSLTWKPSSDTSMTLLSQYMRTRTVSTYQNLPLLGTLLPSPNGPISRSVYTGEPGFDRFNQDQWMLGYELEHRFDETLRFRQNARYGRYSLDYTNITNDPIWLTVDPANESNPANYRLVPRAFASVRDKAKLFNIDNQLEAKFRRGDWQHTVLFGLDHQRTNYEQINYTGGVISPLDLYTPIYGTPMVLPTDPSYSGTLQLKQTGLYIQDQIKFADRWVATLGGRYDSASTETTNRLDGSSTRQKDHKFTGRTGLVYLHPSGVAPYISYAESFSPQTVIDPDSGRPFKPETGKQYEVGVRYQPPGRKETYSAAVFDLRRQNYVTYDANFVPKQTGEVTARGLELEALFNPMPNLNVTAAYSYTPKADVTKSSRTEEIGKQLTAVSKNQVSVWVDYRFNGGMKMGVGVLRSSSTQGYAETLAPRRIPAFTVIDAMIGYDYERWSFALNARNLTDKVYLTSGVGFGSNTNMGATNFGAPRSFIGTATYRW